MAGISAMIRARRKAGDDTDRGEVALQQPILSFFHANIIVNVRNTHVDRENPWLRLTTKKKQYPIQYLINCAHEYSQNL